ncbi:MAG: hypothetical protein WBA64_12055 [Marinomonas sp.]|uniref:hypothetical protein n=1 Tax=Marinomonas sp. TaxID=1904862 RepID=UPI003C726AC8
MHSKSLARFKEDTANHELTVIEDTHSVRHMRFGEKGSPFYAIYITIFPGSLVVTGDMGSYTFSRTTDMFNFFRQKDINPEYWGEKLEAEPRGSEYGKKWSKAAFQNAVSAYLKNNLDDPEDLDEEAHRAQVALVRKIKREVADVEFKEEADEWVRDFAHGEFLFDVFYEYDCTEFTDRYLWILHAIVEVIRQYDILNEQSAA